MTVVYPHRDASWGILRNGTVYAIHCFLLDLAQPAQSKAVVSVQGIGRVSTIDAVLIRGFAGSAAEAQQIVENVKKETA